MKSYLPSVILAMVLAGTLSAEEIGLKMVEQGVEIEFGGPTPLILRLPKMHYIHGDGAEDPVVDSNNGNKVRLSYPCGAKVKLHLDESKLHVEFSDVPTEEIKTMSFSMHIPGSYAGEGKYILAGADKEKFPEQSEEMIFAKGNVGGKLVVFPPKGEAFQIDPPTNWHQIQDNRVNNWGNFFVYTFHFEFKAHTGEEAFDILLGKLEKP